MSKVYALIGSVFAALLLCASAAPAQLAADNTGPMTGNPIAIPAPMLKTSPDATMAQWSSLPDLPVPMQYHGAAYYDGAVYVFGGINANGTGYNLNCYKFTVATNTWSQIASLPEGRALPGVAVVGGKIYLIGGYKSTNPWTILASVLEYDPSANTFTTKANMTFPVFNAAVTAVGGRIFVIGGGNTNFQSSDNGIQVYDPSGDRWEFSLTTAPYKSRSAGIAAIGSDIYLCGGISYVGTTGTLHAELYKGEIFQTEVTWTRMADLPSALIRHIAGTDGSKLYVTGGINLAGWTGGTGPTTATMEYDPAANTWASKEMKPNALFYGGDFVYDGAGKFYSMGGANLQGGTTICEAFSPTAASTPRMSVSVSSISRWAKRGNTVPVPVTIQSLGGQDLTWNASGLEAWLSSSKASGAITPGNKETINVLIDASQLDNGTHSGTFNITSNDPDKPTVAIPVTVRVQDEDVDSDPVVLLEEGTGNWCPYCPDGIDSVKAILKRYPHRVVAIAYHGGRATEPMQTTTTNTWTTQTQLQGWPNGAVNRIKFPGNSFICMSRGEWDQRVREVLDTKRSPVSLTVKSASYDAGQITLEIDALFHRDFDQPVRLNVAQTQDGLNWQQASQSGNIYPFFHDHVLRQMIPNDFGDALFTGSNVTSQTKVTKTFTFASKDSTIPLSQLVIFAHVSDGSQYGEVLQAMEIPLSSFVSATEDIPAAESFSLSQNFPNPFNPSTTVGFSVPRTAHVRIAVSDAYGRELGALVDGMYDAGTHYEVIDASGMPSGTYYLTMRSGAFMQSRAITLVK